MSDEAGSKAYYMQTALSGEQLDRACRAAEELTVESETHGMKVRLISLDKLHAMLVEQDASLERERLLREALHGLRAELVEVESNSWLFDDTGDPFVGCGRCGTKNGTGHEPDCSLARALLAASPKGEKK